MLLPARRSSRQSSRSATFEWLLLCLTTTLCLLSHLGGVAAYQVKLDSLDPLLQTCSGMWPGSNTSVELQLNATSNKGTVATIVYDYKDFARLGKASKEEDAFGTRTRTYVCTAPAVNAGLCSLEEQGNFLVDGDINGTSIVRNRVDLEQGKVKSVVYPVTKMGYYCVAAVPLSSTTPDGSREDARFAGRIFFHNSFEGNLPAGEWPKLQFYFALTCAYILLGAYWGYLCVKHRDDLLMVQYFISGLLGLMVVSTAATWGYQRFLNTHIIDFWSISSLEGKSSVTGTARFLLVLTSVLDATKTSASLAILLCVSMGLSVVRPSIGPVMRRVQILTGIHFVCGVLYSVGIVLILIDSGGAFIFLFIFPLAFTLSTFMMWTLHALNGTIEHLTARKQTFKKNMFTKLYRILLGAVVAIGIFFVMSSVAFARVGGESAAEAWPYRWLLMDGWLGSLYFVVFSAIAYVWRPTGSNARLSMSDELAQDDDLEAEGYEVSEFGPHHEDEEEEEGSGKPARQQVRSGPGGVGGAGGVQESSTMFAVTNSDDEEEDGGATPRGDRRSTSARATGARGEREGLMSGDAAAAEGEEEEEGEGEDKRR